MENHHCQWENPLLMAIFNSYVKLPEGNFPKVLHRDNDEEPLGTTSPASPRWSLRSSIDYIQLWVDHVEPHQNIQQNSCWNIKKYHIPEILGYVLYFFGNIHIYIYIYIYRANQKNLVLGKYDLWGCWKLPISSCSPRFEWVVWWWFF